MNYQKLFEMLPKKTKLWTVRDVQIWLQFINLSTLYPRFREHSVDGSCLKILQQSDLRSELSIKSSLTVRKLLIWVQKGFQEFDEFIDQFGQSLYLGKSQIINGLQGQTKIEPQTSSKNGKIKNQKKELLVIYNTSKKTCINIEEEETIINSRDAWQMYSAQKDYSPFFEYVLIIQKNDKYFLKCLEERHDVYVEVAKPIKIFDGMEIQIANYMYGIQIFHNQVYCFSYQLNKSINIDSFPFSLDLDPFTGMPAHQNFNTPLVRITQNKGQFFIQNSSETYKVWLRLRSQVFMIKEKTNFKIGRRGTQYCCNFFPVDQNEKNIGNTCFVCCSRTRNCLFLQCKHHSTCITCGKMMQSCPICRNPIKDIMRIHHT